MSVVIGIPTFRRPALLARLLDQVIEQAQDAALGPVSVVVADNACDAEVEALVGERALTSPVTVHYRAVPQRGISQARNALIRSALEVDPAWRYLVMYDDDGILTPGCLQALVGTAERLDVDCVSGPVDMGDLGDETRLVRAYLGASLPQPQDGVVESLNGGQNVLIARRLVEQMPDPWFAPHRGLSGGEDYAFFVRAKLHGAVFGWSSRALVLEPLPPQRLTRHAVLRRAFEENAVNAHTEVEFFGYRFTASNLARTLPWVLRTVAAGAVQRDPDKLATAIIGALGAAGRGAGLIGLEPQPYRHGVAFALPHRVSHRSPARTSQ